MSSASLCYNVPMARVKREGEIHRVTLDLPVDLWRQLRLLSLERNQSMNLIVSNLLHEHLGEPQEYRRTPSGASVVNETGDGGAAPPETGEA